MIETTGLVVALLILVTCALRGFSIILASLIAATLVAVTNHLPIADALMLHYATGPLGGFTFAGNFFLLFVAGAVFGRTMAETKAAQSLAIILRQKIGIQHALWVITFAFAILTYGGVVVFIVIFALYPLSVELVREANIPKRLLCAAAFLGAGTFTMTALPGTPSIHNAIAAQKLGTSLFAAPGLGLLAAGIMLVLGLAYLERERKKAADSNEGFVAAPQDVEYEGIPADVPLGWLQALVPLIVVLGMIILPRFLMPWFDPQSTAIIPTCLRFAEQQPILWPSGALFLGTCVALLLHPQVWQRTSEVLSRGAHDAIMPLVNTSVVVGFGGVVAQTVGYASFAKAVVDAPLPPLASLFVAVNVLAGIVGSASGGLRIFMETLAPNYLAMGIEPDVLHRVATIASGGLDTLPHCGAVIAGFTIMGLTHREAYKDLFVVSVLIPLIATVIVILVAGAL